MTNVRSIQIFISYERIHKRSRNCESDIDLKYIEELHYLHEAAYHLLKEENEKAIVYVIEMEGKTVEEIAEEIHQHIRKH
jgi:hypothetical protein